jgi:AhpD family alkylhydroperoxidase
MSTEIASAFEAERMNIAVEAPELSRALVALERELRIDPVLRELVKLRASILNGCAYCIDLHTKDARKADESEQRLYAVAAWPRRPSSTSASERRWRSPTPLPSSPTRTSRRPPTTRPRAISTPRSSPT